MNIALFNQDRITPSPNFKGAICPLCNEHVIAKCGKIKQWHWSHKADNDCDSFGEGETDWHINWKNEFPKEMQEVIVYQKFTNKKHRADIKNEEGIVIELQNSSISSDKIKERENFYGRMIWLINGDTLAQGLCLRQKPSSDIFTFRWKHPPKSWWFSERQIYIDMSYMIKWFKDRNEHGIWNSHINFYKKNNIFVVKKIYTNIPCGGYGYLISKEEFLKIYRGKNGAANSN